MWHAETGLPMTIVDCLGLEMIGADLGSGITFTPPNFVLILEIVRSVYHPILKTTHKSLHCDICPILRSGTFTFANSKALIGDTSLKKEVSDEEYM